MKCKNLIILAVLLACFYIANGQEVKNKVKALPVIEEEYINGIKKDWLVHKVETKSGVFKSMDEKDIILSNGIISRTFRISPNATSTSLKILSDQEELIRAVTPEATVQINNFNVEVGGLNGQANLAFLYTDWIDSLKSSPFAFTLKNFSIGELEKRLDWKQIRPASNTEWPPKGVRLQMDYAMNDIPADGKDHDVIGEIVRLKVQEFAAYSTIKKEKVEELKRQLNILRDITISVNYELYDGVPVLSKWVTIQNNSSDEIIVNNIVSEYLKLADYKPSGGYKDRPDLRKKPNIYLETDYAFGNMNGEIASSSSVHWGTDQDYITQISWNQDILNTVQIYPEHEYHMAVKPKGQMESIRGFILPIDSGEEERRSLHIRKMKRTIVPWITENPMMFHLTGSKPEEVKKALLQCNEIGYEMLNFSFGSSLNMENNQADNLAKFKDYALYADSLGIKLGGYSLFSSRRISEEDDVINPQTGKRGGFAIFGNAPCAGSEWGLEYFGNLVQFFNETGFKTFTQDGPFPGDVCASTTHPGHDGLADSQYKQWKITTDFYKWCKSEGIHLRLPDHYFLTGGNQTAVGYRENNWSLPRREQLVHTRQNLFDGTWEKTPGMSWSFVPLQQYHRGGAAATIEPLNEHLDHYEMMLVSNLGMGLQSVLRGKRLYDTDETKEMVQRVVAWFKKCPNGEEIGENIIRTPTIILKRNGNEIGRIIEYPVKSLEEDMFDILSNNIY